MRVLLNPAPEQLTVVSGRLAETLRRDPIYRAAKVVYIEPHPCLAQIRVNTLIDGKKLLMPTAAMKEGFTLTRPFSVPFPALNFAVSLKGQSEHGEKLRVAGLAGLEVGVLVAAGGMIDPAGLWLGDGKGFLDLAYAILSQAKALAGQAVIYAVPTACLLEKTAPRPWDVRINAGIISEGIVSLTREQADGLIHWDALPEKRIRKITSLWQLRGGG